MTVLISAVLAQQILNSIPTLGETKLEIQLHTGNPGAKGEENIAAENLRPACKFPAVTEAEAPAGRKNSTVPEWKEVKAKETYRFISIWIGIGSFLCWAEMTEPKAVEVGNLFKFPIGSIVFTA
jgi:hypothetical protein